jgi:hypothetical protein
VGDRSRGRYDARRFYLYMRVPRTEGYAYDVGVWDLSIARGPFSVAPCQILVTIRNLFIAVRPWDLLWRPSHTG